MSDNILPCDRDSLYLMPGRGKADYPRSDLTWFLLGAVVQMNLGAIEQTYRRDECEQAEYRPAIMVTLLVYAYGVGGRSSRQIKRLHCLSRDCGQPTPRLYDIGLVPGDP